MCEPHPNHAHFHQCSHLRGGPLDILGGGVSDPKKKFMQEIELEKKIHARNWTRKKNSCMRLKKEKKFVQLHKIV